MIFSGWRSICSNGDALLIIPGRIGYEDWLGIQEEIVTTKTKGGTPDILFLLEHDDVITIGRSGSLEDILIPRERLEEMGIRIYFTNRGGKATYHGPGQIVGYPIMDLSKFGLDIHRYVRMLEEVIIIFLRRIGVEGRRIQGYTGVWVDGGKIASIGVGVRRWVSFHGFALNVDPDMSKFDLINPCGMKGIRMTSLSKAVGRRIPIGECILGLKMAFEDVFGVKLREWRWT